MTAKREYRDRDNVQVAVLDALVDRGQDGLTVLELRSSVNADIDAIETALAELKRDGLITVMNHGGTAVIRPAKKVIPEANERTTKESLFDQLRKRFPF